MCQLEVKTREYNELLEQMRVVTKEKGVAIREHCNLFTELQELRSQVCGRREGRRGEERRQGRREGREERRGRERGEEGRGGKRGKERGRGRC